MLFSMFLAGQITFSERQPSFAFNETQFKLVTTIELRYILSKPDHRNARLPYSIRQISPRAGFHPSADSTRASL